MCQTLLPSYMEIHSCIVWPSETKTPRETDRQTDIPMVQVYGLFLLFFFVSLWVNYFFACELTIIYGLMYYVLY